MEKHENLLTNTITPAYISEISARLTAYRSSLHGHSPRPNDISFDLMCGHYTQAFAVLAANAPFDLEMLLSELSRYQTWVNDLQSGMYVNCVYCGHRYGPVEDTPVSMAEVLKAHIEVCPEHPMSQLKAKLAASQRRDQAIAGIVETVDEDGNTYEFEHYKCPGCKRVLSQRLKGSKASVFTPNYCPDCGQHIDWHNPVENMPTPAKTIVLAHKCLECGNTSKVTVAADERKVTCPRCGATNDFWLEGETPPDNQKSIIMPKGYSFEVGV